MSDVLDTAAFENKPLPEFTRAKAIAITRRIEIVDVPEWGYRVRLMEMTGSMRDSYEMELTSGTVGRNQRLNLTNARAKLIARCLVDANGKPIYNHMNAADIKELGALPGSGLDRVFMACQRLNGLTDEDVKALMGNLQGDQNGASGSD